MHVTPTALACVSALLLASNVAGAPQYPGTIPNTNQQCQDYSGGEYEVRDVVQTEYDAEPELVTGAMCGGDCSLGRIDGWTKTTSVSLGGFNGGTQIANKAWQFLAGAAINPGVSWSWSKAESGSETVTCPGKSNAFVCGFIAQSRMALIKGQAKLKDSDSALCNDSGPLGWQDFEVRAPVRVETWKSENNVKGNADTAVVEFNPCVQKCLTEELCAQARERAMPLCPGTPEPEHWNTMFRTSVLDALKEMYEGDGEKKEEGEGDKQE